MVRIAYLVMRKNLKDDTKAFNSPLLFNSCLHLGLSVTSSSYNLLQIIRMLTDKCRTQEQALFDFEVRKEQYKLLETEVDLLRHQLENTR